MCRKSGRKTSDFFFLFQSANHPAIDQSNQFQSDHANESRPMYGLPLLQIPLMIRYRHTNMRNDQTDICLIVFLILFLYFVCISMIPVLSSF